MEDALPQGRLEPGVQPGHEPTGIGVRGMVIFVMALVGVIAAAEIGLGLWMRSFARKEERVDALYPGRLTIEVDQFPNPRLQKNPRSELAEMKAEEDRLIHSYGWVDQKKGIARIPVERAMDILAKSGLPHVAAPEPEPGAPAKTSIPPARKREEASGGSPRDASAKNPMPRSESKPGGTP
jgi:hypothetical protein